MERCARLLALAVLLGLGASSTQASPMPGAGRSTVRSTPVRGQAGAAIGAGKFDEPYASEFGALILTAHGGVLFGRGVGVGLGVRVMYFQGGETMDGGVVMVPTYESTRVPVLLTPRIQGRHGFIELGVGTAPSWIVDEQGQTVRGPSHAAVAFTAGLTYSDPTLSYHPELLGGAMLIGDGRLLWVGAGLSWW